VFIQDKLCIGCGNCTVRCPWGNIAMFPLPQKEEKEVGGVTKIVELLAVKCDLCQDRDSSACVYNCPTGACIRIKPSEYFEELKLMGIVPIKQR
jgi:Fe-S-cluster-containing hydrogenase component 2